MQNRLVENFRNCTGMLLISAGHNIMFDHHSLLGVDETAHSLFLLLLVSITEIVVREEIFSNSS